MVALTDMQQRILEIVRKHPQGVTVSEIAREFKIPNCTVGAWGVVHISAMVEKQVLKRIGRRLVVNQSGGGSHDGSTVS